jgi:hypothetical protein
MVPVLGKDERSIEGFSEIRIVEGYFQNDQLHGFGRMIKSDGFCATGWWRDGFLMGYAKQI